MGVLDAGAALVSAFLEESVLDSAEPLDSVAVAPSDLLGASEEAPLAAPSGLFAAGLADE